MWYELYALSAVHGRGAAAGARARTRAPRVTDEFFLPPPRNLSALSRVGVRVCRCVTQYILGTYFLNTRGRARKEEGSRGHDPSSATVLS